MRTIFTILLCEDETPEVGIEHLSAVSATSKVDWTGDIHSLHERLLQLQLDLIEILKHLCASAQGYLR